MTVSKYFKHTSDKAEQKLISDLTSETIQQRGLDLWYIPRTNSVNGFDFLFGEDPENFFDTAVRLEMMMVSISTGFEGDDAIGRFGLELADNAVFLCAKTRFHAEVSKKYPAILRPREGDLVVFEVDSTEAKSIFEITYIEKEHPFYQIGKSTVYRMETTRFKYTHEDMITNIPAIDTEDMSNFEDYEDNVPLQAESDTLVNFDESDPFSDGEF